MVSTEDIGGVDREETTAAYRERPRPLGEWLKKWVVNISKYKTTKEEATVLSKGLNFAVSAEGIPTDEYIVPTEQACKFLPEEESHQLRAKVAGLLHSAKPPQSNLAKGEDRP